MDYKHLLRQYLILVLQEEGTDFLTHLHPDLFTLEEQTLLRVLSSDILNKGEI